ncbi:MAG: hypothetical protein L6R36_001663 [Xanthoria steineri]|nr:MAG: hypothetical protein L6R36_001663 [Xanthoria steineri]
MAASGYEITLSDPLAAIDSTVQRLHTNVFNSAFNGRVEISAGEDNKAEMPEARQSYWSKKQERGQSTKPVLEMPRVFLITGTSTGFGRHLVQIVIDAGDIAVGLSPNDTIPAGGLHADNILATARNPSTLSFQNTTPKNYLAVKLDVTSTSDIDNAFSEALSKFGRVDVVINNAGYGLSGPFEELEDKGIRTQMEVNFFGLLNVTKKAMAVMREQKPSGGLIQQVTSIAGQHGVPQFSIYCASKWAVEGFTESISHELKPEWNIRVQTDWSGRSMVFPEKRHQAYDHLDAKKRAQGRHMTQAGEPVKGAKAMYELAIMKDPPLRVVLGSDAYKTIMSKIDTYSENFKKYEKLSYSTDVDKQ